jgi:hypothetical protein
MSIITLEGVVDHGQIRLKTNVHLPENTKVFVIVPDYQAPEYAHVYSPHLAHSGEVADFKMEVSEEALDAEL